MPFRLASTYEVYVRFSNSTLNSVSLRFPTEFDRVSLILVLCNIFSYVDLITLSTFSIISFNAIAIGTNAGVTPAFTIVLFFPS